MNPTALTFEGISKTYARAAQPAVGALDLHVHPGEILALAGESGSGKSTLLRLAAGLERPDAGTIHIGGRLVSSNTVWVAPERRAIGFVFQEGALFPHRTVAQNIRYGLRGLSRAAAAEVTTEMLALIGLEGYQTRYPHELSGGERQRVAIARALAPKPRLVLLDEPFSSLDANLRRTLRDDVCRILKNLETTAILVAHDPDDALGAGDRVAVLKAGRLLQEGAPETVYRRPADAYCASLFGPANRVVTSRQKCVWARPDQFRIAGHGHSEGISATVLRFKNTGKHRETLVRLVESPDIEWVIHDAPEHSVQPGDRVQVLWSKPSDPSP